jgi:hypothetical protein
MISINRNLKRDVWVRSIARDPTDITYTAKGAEPLDTIARLSNVSYNKKASIAGLMEEVADLECMIALPIGSKEPESFKDYITISGVDYRIIEVNPMLYTDCYILTLTYENE